MLRSESFSGALSHEQLTADTTPRNPADASDHILDFEMQPISEINGGTVTALAALVNAKKRNGSDALRRRRTITRGGQPINRNPQSSEDVIGLTQDEVE